MPSQSKPARWCLGCMLLLCTCAMAQPGDPNRGKPPAGVPLPGIEIIVVAGGLAGSWWTLNRHLKQKK